MKKFNYILILFLLFIAIVGCEKEEVITDIRIALIEKTWIKYSHYDELTSNKYQEYEDKDEYHFFNNGKCIIGVLRKFYNESGQIVKDTVRFEYNWSYNEENKTIDFEQSDINFQFLQFDWKIIEISENKIIVRNIQDPDVSINTRELLIRK